MNSSQNIVRFVGLLFIIQMATAVISFSVILEPILSKPDYLQILASKPTDIRIAMFLDLACGLSVFGIAILLYPILKQFSERIALWYVGLRLTELVSFIISGVLILTILSIAIKQNDNDQAVLLAQYLKSARGNTQNISLFLYCFGTSMFYHLLYQSKLIPRFIPIWGLIGVTLLFIEITANIFRTSVGGIMIMMPLGLNEVFLGIWLMIKGFRQVAVK